MLRFAAVLAWALALALAGAAAPAAAVPAEVQLRVEGVQRTLFEGPVRSDARPVDGGDGRHQCGSASPTPITALADAGLDWRGGWNPDFQDFFVERIGPDASDDAAASYWSVLSDWRYVAGGCRAALQPGAEVLWAYGADARPLLLRLSGPGRAAVGETFAVSVRDGRVRPSGDGGPVMGASVAGGQTDGAGVALLRFDGAGLWSLKAEHPRGIRSNALLVCVGDAHCAGAPPGSSSPTPAPPAAPPVRSLGPLLSRAAAARRARRYLLGAQTAAGGFGFTPGASPSRVVTGWAALALDPAAGHASRRALRAARRWLRSTAARPRTAADLERGVLALAGSRKPLDRRAVRRWRAALARRDESLARDTNLAAFALLATPARERSRRRAARRRLLSAQLPGGGFPFRADATSADADTTGAVLWALGRGTPRQARRRAVAYLRSLQGPDGGIGQAAGAGANAQSTALAAIGLQATGASARAPLAYLRAQVGPGGAVAYERGSLRTPVWVTAQALIALRARRT